MYIDPNPITLDITDWKQHGQALHEAIDSAVSDTQAWILQPLPNHLVMTQAQFLDLDKLSGNMQEMHDYDEFGRLTSSTDRLYVTSKNVMECKVVK